ncbi:MAG: hypothetical protein II232_05405, partial [Spirochaetaceae bacterium]|nr:hypothetical protein [Spirochaetaceae bacterium]
FISQQGNKLQKESANAYTAKRAQEMMLRYRGELEQKVQLEALAKHKENILVTNQHTLDLIRKNFSGQERINKAGVVHDRQYANGSIDETRYHAESVNGANTAQFEYYVSIGSDLFEEALNSGKGISFIEAAIDNDAKQFELKVLTPDSANVESLENGTAKYIDISSSINTQENKRQAKKTVNNAYNSYVNDIQRSNENQLSMQYTKLMDPNISDTERLTLATQGYTMLEKMKGEQLDPNVRDEYAKKFSLVKENNGNLLSGSKKSVESFVREMSKTDINGLIDMYCLAAQRGSQSSFGGAENFYTARSALQRALSDSGVNPGETSSALHVLTDKFCETILNQPHLKGAKNRLEAFEKDVYKNRDKWPKDAVDHATGWMLDQLAQSNQSEIDSEDLEKAFDNMLATTYSKNIDKMLVVKNIENEKEVGKVAAGLESIDVVYTDVFGNPRWADNTKDVINSETGVAIQFGKIVSRATGKTDLRQDWKQTDDGTDITNIPVFKDSDGNSYTVEPVYKNNNKEKGVTGYRVVDQNGNEYKTDKESLKKEDDKKRKEFDKKKKEYRENFIKNEEEKRNKKRIERLNTVAKMKEAPSVDDFIKKGVLDSSNKKAFEKTLEILKNDWGKLSKEERLRRVYEIENATGKEYFN